MPQSYGLRPLLPLALVEDNCHVPDRANPPRPGGIAVDILCWLPHPKVQDGTGASFVIRPAIDSLAMLELHPRDEG